MQICSLSASVVMSFTYGLDIADSNDRYVALAETTNIRGTAAILPGATHLNTFPFCMPYSMQCPKFSQILTWSSETPTNMAAGNDFQEKGSDRCRGSSGSHQCSFRFRRIRICSFFCLSSKHTPMNDTRTLAKEDCRIILRSPKPGIILWNRWYRDQWRGYQEYRNWYLFRWVAGMTILFFRDGADPCNTWSRCWHGKYYQQWLLFLLLISFIDSFHIINLLPGPRSAFRNSGTCSSRDWHGRRTRATPRIWG